MDRSEIIGTGWSFPVEINARGGIAMARAEQDIDQAMVTIIMTPIGQRIMRPRFGCRIHELLFDPNQGATFGLARRYVAEALEMWEPRIRLLEVHVSQDAEFPERMRIQVDYEVKNTYDRRALVVPFYHIPEEP